MSSGKDFWLGRDVGARDREAQDRIWKPLQLQTRGLYRSAKEDKLQALRSVQSGIRGANLAVTGAQRGMVRRGGIDSALDAAADKKSLADRGLSSSAEYVDSGAQHDRSRARAAIRAGIASLRANVAMAGGSALANEYNSVAELETTSMEQQAQIEASRIEAYNRIRRGRAGGALGIVGTVVGGIVGGYFGGFGGAAAGASAGNKLAGGFGS